MKRFKGKKGTIILFLLLCMLLCYYFYLSNKKEEAKEEVVETTYVQEVLLRDLSRNYPATPKEVLKYYCEITQCFYNEEYSEEQLKELGDKAMQLYDEELAAYQPEMEYMNNLKADIAAFAQDEIRISSFKVSSSTDVDYYSVGEREYAKLYSVFTLRKGTHLQPVEEMFILRRDADGHWKILGWEEVREGHK